MDGDQRVAYCFVCCKSVLTGLDRKFLINFFKQHLSKPTHIKRLSTEIPEEDAYPRIDPGIVLKDNEHERLRGVRELCKKLQGGMQANPWQLRGDDSQRVVYCVVCRKSCNAKCLGWP